MFPFKQHKAKIKHTKLLIPLHQPTQCLKHSSGRMVDGATAIKPHVTKANLISAHFVRLVVPISWNIKSLNCFINH